MCLKKLNAVPDTFLGVSIFQQFHLFLGAAAKEVRFWAVISRLWMCR
jgi:hypothetical protein